MSLFETGLHFGLWFTYNLVGGTPNFLISCFFNSEQAHYFITTAFWGLRHLGPKIIKLVNEITSA